MLSGTISETCAKKAVLQVHWSLMSYFHVSGYLHVYIGKQGQAANWKAGPMPKEGKEYTWFVFAAAIALIPSANMNVRLTMSQELLKMPRIVMKETEALWGWGLILQVLDYLISSISRMKLVMSILGRAKSWLCSSSQGRSCGRGRARRNLDTAHNSCLMHTEMVDDIPNTVPGSWDGTYDLELIPFMLKKIHRWVW